MASIQIDECSLPDITGKVAVITGTVPPKPTSVIIEAEHRPRTVGGSSGIGYAAACILASHGTKVHILDLNPPDEERQRRPIGIEFTACNVASWDALSVAFERIGHLDLAFANAGVSEEADYFQDTFDESGRLQEPGYSVLDVNFRAVLNFVKLSWSKMRKQGTGGSIVITTSATAYAPERSLPVYSAAKLAVSLLNLHGVPRGSDMPEAPAEYIKLVEADKFQLVGLIRSLRSTTIRDNVTINAVAPAATITKLLPEDLAQSIIAAGLPVSSAHFVGLALVYSAIAKEYRQVEAYGKDRDSEMAKVAPWNGRVILTLGDRYTELEEPIASQREQWFGKENTELTRMQQAATDFR